MAERGDDGGDPPLEGETARRRRASALASSGPSVGRSLDQFIARANEQSVDVTPFDTATRERSLAEQLELATSKLAAAELRATIAERRGQRRWLGLTGAFVVGGVFVAALAWIVPRSDHASPPTASAPVAPSALATPTQVKAPPAAITATPIEPAANPTPAPVEPVSTPPRPSSPEQTRPVVSAKPPHRARTAKSTAAPTPTPTPPTETKHDDPGLYNPF